jgi:hypothetical protein
MLLSVVGGVSVMWPAVVVVFGPLRGVFVGGRVLLASLL